MVLLFCSEQTPRLMINFNVQLEFTALDREGLTLLLRDCHKLCCLKCVTCESLHIDLSLLLIGQTEEKTHRQSLGYSVCTSVRLNWWIVAPEDWSQIPLIVKKGNKKNKLLSREDNCCR